MTVNLKYCGDATLKSKIKYCCQSQTLCEQLLRVKPVIKYSFQSQIPTMNIAFESGTC